jgi:hypothetical protein
MSDYSALGSDCEKAIFYSSPNSSTGKEEQVSLRKNLMENNNSMETNKSLQGFMNALEGIMETLKQVSISQQTIQNQMQILWNNEIMIKEKIEEQTEKTGKMEYQMMSLVNKVNQMEQELHQLSEKNCALEYKMEQQPTKKEVLQQNLQRKEVESRTESLSEDKKSIEKEKNKQYTQNKESADWQIAGSKGKTFEKSTTKRTKIEHTERRQTEYASWTREQISRVME